MDHRRQAYLTLSMDERSRAMAKSGDVLEGESRGVV